MPASSWLAHVKEVHSKGNTSFKESLKRASTSWKKKAKGSAPKARKGKKKAVEEVEEVAEAGAVPKKKRRRRKAGPKVPAKAYKNVDSRNL